MNVTTQLKISEYHVWWCNYGGWFLPSKLGFSHGFCTRTKHFFSRTNYFVCAPNIIRVQNPFSTCKKVFWTRTRTQPYCVCFYKNNSFSFHFTCMLFSKKKLGNIEKCPFTYWLNGRWFPQIVDMDRGNLCPIYICSTNCGVSFWTCWREISSDRIALFNIFMVLNF